MKKKVLKAVAYIAAIGLMFGASCCNSVDLRIPLAICIVCLSLIGLLLYANIDYLERHYGQGGFIKSEPMVEAVIPHDQMNRVFANYDLSKDKK